MTSQTLELLTEIEGKSINAQQGLRVLGTDTYSFAQNLKTKVKTPVLEDGTNLWGTWLDSKTMQLYGGKSQEYDNRHVFKIDHDFDLSVIINSSINSNGSISIDETRYTPSQGKEFVIISESDLKGAEADYAVSAKDYESIKEQLARGEFKAEDLEKAGGFKINEWLAPEEVSTHAGWLELAVGKNNATEQDYAEASRFLKEDYVPKAESERCFRGDGKGLGFFVVTDEEDYAVRPWFVNNSDVRSYASGRGDFYYLGGFLRVLDEKSAEGGAQKIGYDEALKMVLETPFKDEKTPLAFLEKVTKHYQAKTQNQ